MYHEATSASATVILSSTVSVSAWAIGEVGFSCFGSASSGAILTPVTNDSVRELTVVMAMSSTASTRLRTVSLGHDTTC
jgi:hypothetical protein